MLKGIDISSWNAGIDPSKVDADFIIVKATGGTSYVNPYFKQQADAVLKAGKKLGIYHYAYERTGWGTAKQEAAHFLKYFEPYIGKAIPVLDFEADAQSLPITWPSEWLHIVAMTGATPWFYAYASYLNSRDHSVLHRYPLWMASYLTKYSGKGYQSNPEQIWGIGGWSKLTCYQYTSQGRISGWNGNLDLNVFYGTTADWDAMCGGKKVMTTVKKTITFDAAKVAAQIHADMCNDDRNGYSWAPRTGGDSPAGSKTLTIGGKIYGYTLGSWDCSSSTIKAWQEAIKYTPYAGKLDAATYTGNMASVFVNSGLFEVRPVALAQAGDLYLNHQYHVAMSQGNGKLSQFSINENGGAYGGRVGDQTGKEAYITNYFNYPWDCVLHYNGKANTITYEEEVNDLQKVTNTGGPVYRLYNKKGWHLLTLSKDEVKKCVNNGWVDEGVSFTAPKGGVVPVYRFYNPHSSDHLYTADYKEAEKVQKSGWKYEGVPFFGIERGTCVYRLYNKKLGQHHYTQSVKERDTCKKNGWTDEGVAWYV